MSFSHTLSRITQLRKELRSVKQAAAVIDAFARFLAEELEADVIKITRSGRCFAFEADFDGRGRVVDLRRNPAPIEHGYSEAGQLLLNGDEVALPLFVNDSSRAQVSQGVKKYLQDEEIVSYGIVELDAIDPTLGIIELQYRRRFHRWTREDALLVGQCADFLTSQLEQLEDCQEPQEHSTGVQPKERESYFRGAAAPDGELTGTLLPVLEAAGWGVLSLGEDGSVNRANHIVESMSGLSRYDIEGAPVRKTLAKFLSEESCREISIELQELLMNPQGPPRDVRASGLKAEHTDNTYRVHLLQSRESTSDERYFIVLRKEGQRASDDALVSNSSREYFERLAEYGNLVVIRTDDEFRITDIFGNTAALLNADPNDLLASDDVWSEFVLQEDLRKLARRIRRMGDKPVEFSEEIRVVNRKTSAITWLMLFAVPRYSKSKEFLGWEGFGIDITARLRAQQDLFSQSRRIEALYEVARALEITMDPALVALRGLRAVMGATSSDSGFACFYDQDSGKVEVVAAEGVSQRYLEELGSIIGGNSLVRRAVESRKGFLIDNIQKDERAAREVAKIEDLKSTIVMPVMNEGEVLGAIVISCRAARRYNEADFELVNAAANQIGLVARQAEYYLTEKQQADSLAALYRLSHELSHLFNPQEIAEHAFPILQQELACKRMWLGVVNEAGTHIVGQGGFGPGIRKHIKEVQVELGLRHDFLDEAISTKQPVIVRRGDQMECSGLNRLLQRLKLGDFVIVPLVSLGQVVGVFIVEPSAPSTVFIQRKLSLLTSMANEIATIILTRRFETKMADADKMRVAGMLASGVAHNFNNLLQAVMGQASLIEMQIDPDSPLVESAKTITEAAGRGAALIKQLLTFSHHNGLEQRELAVSDMLSELKDLYRSVLGSSIAFDVEIVKPLPSIIGDSGQLQQVVMNLLMNAREAIGGRSDGRVEITTSSVRLRSGEVDPELSPGEYIKIDVKDNGVGMDAERQTRCFEPFFTTKDVDRNTGIGLGGAGLGLSSAYSIVRQHGGVITVSSILGAGAVFSIFLPAAQIPGRANVIQDIVEDAAVPALIFDLDDSVAFSVRSTLESLGVDSLLVSDREAVLQEITSNSAVKLLIIDADRFGDGLAQFMQDVRQARIDVRVIVTSVDRGKWSRALGSFENVNVVEKPLGVWAIHSVVRELLPAVRGSRLHDNVIREVAPILTGEEVGQVLEAEVEAPDVEDELQS